MVINLYNLLGPEVPMLVVRTSNGLRVITNYDLYLKDMS